jgi:hypothetical protein
MYFGNGKINFFDEQSFILLLNISIDRFEVETMFYKLKIRRYDISSTCYFANP